MDELVSLLKDNKDALILDLAAGTGIIGQYVSVLGKQWRIQRGARNAPRLNFIHSHAVFAKKFCKIIGWCTHFWEILIRHWQVYNFNLYHHYFLTAKVPLHQVSASMLGQLCDNASDYVLTENNGVALELGCVLLSKKSIVFHQSRILSCTSVDFDPRCKGALI